MLNINLLVSSVNKLASELLSLNELIISLQACEVTLNVRFSFRTCNQWLIQVATKHFLECCITWSFCLLVFMFHAICNCSSKELDIALQDTMSSYEKKFSENMCFLVIKVHFLSKPSQNSYIHIWIVGHTSNVTCCKYLKIFQLTIETHI